MESITGVHSLLHCYTVIHVHVRTCIIIKVSTAASSLKEEKARADDREALLKETLLRERDKEDRYDMFQHRRLTQPVVSSNSYFGTSECLALQALHVPGIYVRV